jgi:HlyD family secretion protein
VSSTRRTEHRAFRNVIDTVKRGPMLRQVRGVVTLVTEEVRVIAASTEGRIKRILVQPGTEVSAGTVLLDWRKTV